MTIDGPFTTIKVEEWVLLHDVVCAARRLMEVVAEFPKDQTAWWDHLDALQKAVDRVDPKP